MFKELAVLSPSFSANVALRSATLEIAESVRFNDDQLPLSTSKLLDFIGKAEAIILGLDVLTKEVLEHCSGLRYVSKYGVGTDNIDWELFAEFNLRVALSEGSNAQSVAEYTLGNIIGLLHNVSNTMPGLKAGYWNKSGGTDLRGKNVGILGLGHIGKQLCKMLQQFGVEIAYYDPKRSPEMESEGYLRYLPFESLLSSSDVLTIHASLNETSRNMIGFNEFELMKVSSYLVNYARSDIVEFNALRHEVLNNKKLAGVALDVYPFEPFDDVEFLSCPRVFCTPHTAGNSREAVLSMGQAAIKSLVKLKEDES